MDTQGKQSATHPQMHPLSGSKIKVPSGSKGSSPEDMKGDKGGVAHGVPGGGRKKNTAYATPQRSKPSPTAKEHGMDANAKGSPFPGGNAMPGNTTQVNQQPRVPFDQNDMQPANSGQSFPYGASGGFGRLL